MKLKINFRPLDGWPDELTPSWERVFGQFKVTYSQNMEALEKELRMIEADNATIFLDVKESQIRQDGFLRADAAPGHPGVMLSFTLPGQSPDSPTEFHSDQYRSWHFNLRGIVLTLEAARGMGRWGATKRSQQYEGFKLAKSKTPSLMAATGAQSAIFGSVSEAVRFLAFVAESSHWEVDVSNQKALDKAIDMAKTAATSPAQVRLVEAAATLIKGK